MTVTPHHRRIASLLAAGVVVAAGITGLVARAAAADPVLPPLTPADLLTRVAQARPAGLSATFEQRSDLGLPALPTVSGSEGDGLQSALAMLTGNHTVRVWIAGTDHVRVALVDGSTETSAIRNGDQFWLWSSEKQQARHATLKAGEQPTATPLSPTEAVQRLLAAVGPSTDVTTSGTGTVAGRPVYQLVLTPKDNASLVGQVRISVDATEFVPLAARVIADDGSDAITVTATSVDFSRPDSSIFAFTPPPGAEVSELKPPDKSAEQPAKTGPKPTVVGSGWTTVAVAKLDTAKPDQTVAALLKSLPEVSGNWGHGRLLSTTLVNAVITDDGRVAVGSVTPERLYAALAKK
jgi:outer membrane lipoprotein-sorting protein